jgi:transaldolase
MKSSNIGQISQVPNYIEEMDVLGLAKTKNTNLLEQLKTQTIVVADTGDFESMRKYNPTDATTNPSLIYKACQDTKYLPLLEEAIVHAKSKSSNKKIQLSIAIDKLYIAFGLEILKIVPGRVSTEVDPRLSYDTEGTVSKAKELIGLYEEAGIDRERILIKIAATWEGIKAAERLTKDGIHCNLTLIFSISQAVACAEEGVQLISPFVGRILDWHLKNNKDKQISPADEPGVLLVKNIYNYFKKYRYRTKIMAASFRNIGEIAELTGCDLMTISPELLGELQQREGILERKLISEVAKKLNIKRLKTDEKKFRQMMAQDVMASEKLAEGIKKFSDDIIKLEKLLEKKMVEQTTLL